MAKKQPKKKKKNTTMKKKKKKKGARESDGWSLKIDSLVSAMPLYPVKREAGCRNTVSFTLTSL